jgi:Predicted periplasmic solute-binding protein
MLCRVLCKNYWKIDVEFEDFNFSDSNIDFSDSYIIIGDKALENSGKFKYVYDLATEWINFKQKPFVFACWFANNKLDKGFIEQFNEALTFGVTNIASVVQNGSFNFSKEYVYKYLSENISYNLDSLKREGLHEFWQLAMAEMRSKVRW